MKCPKCDYLGFETGDRCRNCGYDFSLLSVGDSAPPDYEIHPTPVDEVPVHLIDEDLEIGLTPRAPLEPDLTLEPGPDFAQAMTTPDVVEDSSSLPLFTPTDEDGDEPMIKVPAAPRPPLAVRRTPDASRLRVFPRSSSRPSAAPVLQFSEEVVERPSPPEETRVEPIEPVEPVERVPSGVITEQPSRPGARVLAMVIDHVILLGIDAGVIYFTVRMAGLTMNEWRALPVAPMLTFLGLLEVAYFYAFTAVGGQTIGKMAVGTCVVTDGGQPVDAARAMRRTFGGIVSFLLLGLGFLPALFGDYRALHDRLAGTRVVRLRSV